MYPTLFQIGNFEVSTFGLMVVIAFLAGGELTARSFDRFGLDREDAWRLITWCVIGGMLGAKLWYFAEYFARNPVLQPGQMGSVDFWRSGLTWYGGFAGGTLAALIAARVYRIPIPTLVDLAAPSLAAGQALGRIGCFLVGDDYGRTTDLPWGVAFPQGLPPTLEPVHPTMLYETLWLGLAALWLWRRRGRSPFLFGEYLFLAGAGRLWIEILRLNPAALGPLSNAQAAASLCMLVGAAGWLYLAQRARGLSRSAPL